MALAQVASFSAVKVAAKAPVARRSQKARAAVAKAGGERVEIVRAAPVVVGLGE